MNGDVTADIIAAWENHEECQGGAGGAARLAPHWAAGTCRTFHRKPVSRLPAPQTNQFTDDVATHAAYAKHSLFEAPVLLTFELCPCICTGTYFAESRK